MKMQIGENIASYVDGELGKYRWLSVSTFGDIEFQPARGESKCSATGHLSEFITRLLFHLPSCKLRFFLIITSSIDNNFLNHCSCDIFRVIEFQIRVSDRVMRYSANGLLARLSTIFHLKTASAIELKIGQHALSCVQNTCEFYGSGSGHISVIITL